jgi:hypothetical protein
MLGRRTLAYYRSYLVLYSFADLRLEAKDEAGAAPAQGRDLA